MRLQKYSPEYVRKMKKINIIISAELYQAIAVKAVIARGIKRLAPKASKLPPEMPLPSPVSAILLDSFACEERQMSTIQILWYDGSFICTSLMIRYSYNRTKDLHFEFILWRMRDAKSQRRKVMMRKRDLFDLF